MWQILIVIIRCRDCVHHNTHKLQKLGLGQESLPRTTDFEQRQRVVGIHKDVNEAIEEGAEVGVPTRDVFDGNPPCPGYGCVVVDVEEGHLSL